MMRASTAALGWALLATLSPVVAKDLTSRITIKGGDLAQPVEITDYKVVQFHVWSGRGAYKNSVEETEGFIIDWLGGVVTDRPGGLRRYDVSFHSHRLLHVVAYEYDPVTDQGYVYLPGKGEDGYELNTSRIFRGVEGNWFRANNAWRDMAKRYIASISGRSTAPLR